ncbi:MAG: hypothetical protein M3Z56_07425 [Bacteroidota bacterium]|nr:hypothetical protein [Bacteroidota bacterium]
MKTTFFSLLAATILAGACNNSSQKTTDKTSAEDTTKSSKTYNAGITTSCFTGITGKDTVHLKIDMANKVVKGELSYKRFEKDNNTGTIAGTMKGDTLLADYTFMSEGKQSVRQVVFLIKDTAAIEGYGEVEERNNKMVFKNISQIPFEKGQRLHKVPCVY